MCLCMFVCVQFGHNIFLTVCEPKAMILLTETRCHLRCTYFMIYARESSKITMELT